MSDFAMTFAVAASVGLIVLALLYMVRRDARLERAATGTMGGFDYRVTLIAANDDGEDEAEEYDPQEDIPTMPARYID